MGLQYMSGKKNVQKTFKIYQEGELMWGKENNSTAVKNHRGEHFYNDLGHQNIVFWNI